MVAFATFSVTVSIFWGPGSWSISEFRLHNMTVFLSIQCYNGSEIYNLTYVLSLYPKVMDTSPHAFILYVQGIIILIFVSVIWNNFHLKISPTFPFFPLQSLKLISLPHTPLTNSFSTPPLSALPPPSPSSLLLLQGLHPLLPHPFCCCPISPLPPPPSVGVPSSPPPASYLCLI